VLFQPQADYYKQRYTVTGTNTNAVPSRGSNYTAGTPAQTAATDFQTGNTEAFVTADLRTGQAQKTAHFKAPVLQNLALMAIHFLNGAKSF
jgi:hypothetical protein